MDAIVQTRVVSSDANAPKDEPAAKPAATPPDGIRSTTRVRTGTPAATPSRPTAESETFGRIYRMVAWLDIHKGAFCISRLISQSGYNLRTYKQGSKDDARVISKLWPLLDAMLTEEERQVLMKALREGT